MDAILKELKAWNLTFFWVLATLINLMLKKYFSVLVRDRWTRVLVEDHIVNVICKLLREVAVDEAPLLKKFSLKLQGKNFSLFKLGDPKLPYLISGLTRFQSPAMYYFREIRD